MRFPMAIRVPQAAVGTLLFLLIASANAQLSPPFSEVRVTVLDQSGAAIPDCEVVFKGDSGPMVVHTGGDGSATVRLQSGRYAVTATHFGFMKKKVVGLEVGDPRSAELRIVLMVHSSTCNPCSGDFPGVPTITSDLPDAITLPPVPVVIAPPIEPRVRSPRCLYLWKCSNS